MGYDSCFFSARFIDYPLPPLSISERFPANRCWWRPSVHLVFFVAHGPDGYGSTLYFCANVRLVFGWASYLLCSPETVERVPLSLGLYERTA